MAEELVEKKTRKTAVKTDAEKAPAKRTTKKVEDGTTEKKVVKTAEEVSVEKKASTKRVAKKAEENGEKVAVKKTVKKATKSNSIPEFLGTGKRKSSVARVRIAVGTGEFKVNGKDIKEYNKQERLSYIAKQPLTLTELDKTIDVKVNVYGGGIAGQAGAIRHGITKALLEFRPELRPELKKAGFITRDARIKERKKYGLKKARKAPQFSKR